MIVSDEICYSDLHIMQTTGRPGAAGRPAHEECREDRRNAYSVCALPYAPPKVSN